MTNPLYDPFSILSKVYREGTYLKQAIASTPVEPANKARTVKICYGVAEKDAWLEAVISANAPKPPRSAVKIILKIAIYMLEFMGKRDYMVDSNRWYPDFHSEDKSPEKTCGCTWIPEPSRTFVSF